MVLPTFAKTKVGRACKLKHCFNVAQDEVANPEIKIFDERLS